ncbi:hypothetical protein [Aeromonas veronii]|uniref:hypothetical protein n=1 Tax=Aeromonas veronii TaxID=654 RepID=UPI001F0AA54E|nr:hypothetical protein [Aeromonas veronii]
MKDKVEGNIAYMVRNLALACTVEAARELQVDLPLSFRSGANGRDTAFHEQAKQLDKTRSAPYWATTRELFARAGRPMCSINWTRRERGATTSCTALMSSGTPVIRSGTRIPRVLTAACWPSISTT